MSAHRARAARAAHSSSTRTSVRSSPSGSGRPSSRRTAARSRARGPAHLGPPGHRRQCLPGHGSGHAHGVRLVPSRGRSAEDADRRARPDGDLGRDREPRADSRRRQVASCGSRRRASSASSSAADRPSWSRGACRTLRGDCSRSRGEHARDGAGVRLCWTPPASCAQAGFYVYRRAPEIPGSNSKLLNPSGPSRARGQPLLPGCVDAAGELYEYQLMALLADGSWQFFAPVSTRVSGSPATFFLAAPFPNPFHSATGAELLTIRFGVPAPCLAGHLAVFDASGRVVRTLMKGACPAGIHAVPWDGREDSGARRRAGSTSSASISMAGARCGGRSSCGEPGALFPIVGSGALPACAGRGRGHRKAAGFRSALLECARSLCDQPGVRSGTRPSGRAYEAGHRVRSGVGARREESRSRAGAFSAVAWDVME